MASTSELRALDPQTETVKLTTGTEVAIEDLRARQFFKLLRIITHGAMPVLGDMRMLPDPSGDSEAFVSKLLSLMLLSIPDAEDETIAFIRSMCAPVGLRLGRHLNKQDTEHNTSLWARLDDDLDNPELDDLVTIVEAIIRRESADIQALGKRLAAMFNLASRTGQLSAERSTAAPTPPTTPTSSADSPESSTSSPTTTDGPTPTSPTSP